MTALTLQNGFLTFNKKRYKDCDPNERKAFNEHFSDEKLLKTLKKATEPLLVHYQQVTNNLEEIEPHFV